MRGKEIGILVTGGKKASAMLHSGEVSGKEAGVLVDGGSFTMEGGTIYGAQCGIHVGGTPKSTVKIGGGDIKADETALFAKQGSSVSLSGGTFTAGQNALAAGESTMKGWLAKGYDMIGPNLPGGFDPAKESGTGAGTVMIVTEDSEPAQIVMDMIDEIGKVELTDECERKILDAEEAYEMLTAAQQKKVTNYKTLLKARQTYDKQVAEREYAEQAGYVNYLMEEIPADMEKIESSTLSVIREAEEAYNEAAKDKNVKKYLDSKLVSRLKSARKTYDKNEKAAGKVQDLIDDLPAPEELTYAKDRKSVTRAQTAFENLTIEVVYVKKSTGGGSGTIDSPNKPTTKAPALTLNTDDHFAFINGYPDGSVQPEGNVTRAETAAILYRIMGDACQSYYKTNSSSYSDVARGDWYNTYVATLENAGVIVDTRTNGKFRPNDAITRAELASMIAQFAGLESASAAKFNDVGSRYWAAEEIAIAAKMGWINGYPDGSFRPDRNVTRAELMAMVNRALGRTPKSAGDLLSGMKTWRDNANVNAWYYLDVQEATNDHTYTKSGTHETWKKLL